jgi:tetratricopeptide (TPR) repeat protein
MGFVANRKPRRSAPQPRGVSVASTPRPSFQSRFAGLLAAVGLCIATLIAYANSFRGGFIVDSDILVLQDARLQQASADNISLIFHHTYWWPFFESGLYRPVTTLSFLFNYSVIGNGADPAGYHWINLLLHLVSVLLLFGICLRLMRSYWPSVFVAAVWAVHPVLTGSVTNIAGRADLLVGVALLSGFWMYLKSTESSGPVRMALLVGLAAATTVGVFSKENAVAILGVIVLYEFAMWKGRKQLKGALLGCLALLPPLFLMWYQRSVVLADTSPPTTLFVDNPLTRAGFLTARLTALKVLGKYLWLLIWPSNLSWDHSYNQIPLVQGGLQDWFALLTVGAALIISAILFKRNRLAFFFLGFAFVAMVPTSNLIILIGTIMAERFLYLPSIGFAACVVLGVYEVGRRVKSPVVSPVILGVIIAAFGARTLVRNNDWSTPLAMDASGVRNSPDSFKTHDALGSDLFEADHSFSGIEKAIDEADASIAIINVVPDAQNTARPFTNAGIYYERRGDQLALRDPDRRNPEIVKSYQKSLQLLLRARTIDSLAGDRFVAGEKARGKLDSEIAPQGLPQLYQNLALTYVRLGDLANAYEAATRAKSLAPDRADYVLLSALSSATNHKDEAATALIEGFLTTHNSAFLPRLRNLYSGGLDPKGCAFIQTANGLNLNYSCEIVYVGLCKASAELMDIYRKKQKPEVAADFERQATEEFGCSRIR